jgi:predicted DNA-binding protein (MmcQ/YjbR family)
MAPHRFGGTAFRLGKREVGHIHGDRLVDIPFPKLVRDELVSSGEAEPHHILPKSGWVSLFLRTEADVERAIRLMRNSFDLGIARQNQRHKENSNPTPE